MKLLILLLGSFFLCTICKAQFNLGLNAGYSFGKSPVAGLDIGYNLKEINFRGGFYSHLSDKLTGGIVSYIRAGHTFDLGNFYATGSAGYAFLYKSSDTKSLNHSTVIYGAEFGYKYEFREQSMAVYLGASKASEMTILAVGVRGFFN